MAQQFHLSVLTRLSSTRLSIGTHFGHLPMHFLYVLYLCVFDLFVS